MCSCPAHWGCSRCGTQPAHNQPGVGHFVGQALAPAFVDSEPLAALYGRADHLRRQEAALTGEERVALFFRAIYLLLAFAPFLLLGVPLLLIAACLPSQGQGADGTATEVSVRCALPGC